jgi:hypothetical protein
MSRSARAGAFDRGTRLHRQAGGIALALAPSIGASVNLPPRQAGGIPLALAISIGANVNIDQANWWHPARAGGAFDSSKRQRPPGRPVPSIAASVNLHQASWWHTAQAGAFDSGTGESPSGKLVASRSGWRIR